MAINRKINKLVSTKLGFRDRRNTLIRDKLNGLDFSVFSNNCIGGVFLHDAGKRFNSPMVNLSMGGVSFISLCENPMDYIEPKFEFLHNSGLTCPVGVYKNIRVSFVHYKTEEEAQRKWIERAKRIIWEDIYIIATGHNGLEAPELMERFDRLPYKKVMFTHHAWPNYEWAHHVRMLDKMEEMPPLTEYATPTGARIYETAFDLASWIKECEHREK